MTARDSGIDKPEIAFEPDPRPATLKPGSLTVAKLQLESPKKPPF